jgi:hypothetical protein
MITGLILFIHEQAIAIGYLRLKMVVSWVSQGVQTMIISIHQPMDTIKIIVFSHVYPFHALIYGFKFILKFKK